MSRISRFFLLLLFFVTYSTNAAELPIVSAAVPWADTEGYTPVIITVSSSNEQKLTIRAQVDSVEARIAMVVGGGQAVRATLLLPPLQTYGGQIEITWSSDDGMNGDLAVSPTYAHRRLALAVIDSDESIPLKNLDFANATTFSTHASKGYYHATSGAIFSARVPRANLPERWQGYPTWMTLVFAASDDVALAAEQRSAIATWVAAGGTVVIAISAQREAWRKVGVEPWLLNSSEKALINRLNRIGAEKENPNVLISVPGTESVPATGFMLLATLFAVVVGPLNLWWVRRRGAPALFLLTTPALSLITCVVLLGANIIIEGLSLRRVACQPTVLDQQHARAVAWTRASYYGGFSVARFDVDSDAKVRRFEPDQDNSNYYRLDRRGSESHAIDWRGGQHLSGEWIPARRNRQLLYVNARTERAQLQLTRKGNHWQVTNGLGTTLRQLTWHDGDNVVYKCGPLQTGESAELAVETHGTAIAIGDFDGAAEHAATIRNEPWGFAAELESSFGALPGPVGLDAVPLTSYVVGRLNPGSTP